MPRWTYDISRHSLGQVLEAMRAHGFSPADAGSRVLFCDQEGGCFFDDPSDPYQEALKDILNERGQDGWELVQVAFRERELICFWRKPAE